MSGRNSGVVGSKRGYVLTDEAAKLSVAALLDASPPHSGRSFDEVAAAKFPYTLRANARGLPCTLVLTVINGVEQSVLVDRQGGSGKRRMTCVPLRFDQDVFQMGVVASAVLLSNPEPILVLEDILYMGGGTTESANAVHRAVALHDLVHERHRADPVLQPFKLQAARHLTADGSTAREIWRTYRCPIGSFTLCPLNIGQRDMWVRINNSDRAAAPPKPVQADKATKNGTVMVRAADMPDVYMVEGSGGPLVVRSIADSAELRSASKKNKDRAFSVAASWDAASRRYVYVRDIAQ